MFELEVDIREGDFNPEQLKEQFTGEYFVKYTAEHAIFVEFGTVAHDIRPKDKNALHFHTTKGRTQHKHAGGHARGTESDAVFAKKVRHPGTVPQPFLRPAVEEARVRLPEFIKKGWTMADIAEFIFLRSQDIIESKNIIDKGTLLKSGKWGQDI